MNIVVLAGGLSTEREVSLSSGYMVYESLKRSGHNVLLLDSFFGMEEVPDDITEVFSVPADSSLAEIKEQEPDVQKLRAGREDSGRGTLGKNVLEICRAADIVYIGLHGEDGENGRMQAFFDVLEIKYTGSGYLGSAMGMHKGISKDILAASGVVMPKGRVFINGDALNGLDGFKFPCIAKPCSGGSSIGLTVADTPEKLKAAIKAAFRYEDEIMVEEFIKGREFSVGILGGKSLPPIEIKPRSGIYDYAHKYQAGWTEEICPADITAEEESIMRSAAEKVFEVLQLDVYARVDFILDENGEAYCLEANTLPGMTPTSLLPQQAAADGISYDELCLKIIDLSFDKYGERNEKI